MPGNSNDIIKAMTNGRSIGEIAAEHGMSEEAVTALLDQHAAKWFEGPALRRELAFEIARLETLIAKYYALAMEGKGDVNAAAIYLKGLMRQSLMAGLEAPATHAAVILQKIEMNGGPTTTDEIEAAIDRLRKQRDKPQLDASDPELSAKPH
jgi:hypothetical protein